MRADRSLLVIAGLLSLIATTLLALAPVAVTALSDAAVQRRVETADPSDGGIEITGRIAAEDAGSTVEEIVAGQEVSLRSLWLSRSGSARFEQAVFDGDGLESATLDETNTVTAFVAMSEASGLLTWNEGRAPAAGETALHRDAADTLGFRIGDSILTDLSPEGLLLVGIFEPVDRRDPRWWAQPLIRDGIVPGESFTTVGPLLVTATTLVSVEPRTSLIVRLLPEPSALSANDSDKLRALPASIDAAVNAADTIENAQVRSDLDVLFIDIDQSLDSSRAVVVALLLMVAALSLPALAIAAGLLVDTRRVETALVSSRGASRRQIILAASAEALVIATVVALAAIPAAFATLAIVAARGAAADLVINPSVDVATAVTVLIGVLLSTGVIMAPLWRTSSYSEARAASVRDDQQPFLRRTRIDIVLVVLACLGLWQIHRSSSDTVDQAGVGPSVVIGPALALAAGALLALRAVRIVASSAQVLFARSPHLTGSLVARSISRRPTTLGRSTSLILLAVAIGSFALIHWATWESSQSDQANAEVGDDIRVSVNQRSGRLPDQLLAPAAAGVAGVANVAPSFIGPARLGVTNVDLLMVDVRDLADLSGSGVGDGGALAEPTEAEFGLPLDGNRLSVDIDSVQLADVGGEQAIDVSVTLQDSDGLVFDVPAMRLPIGEQTRLSFPLSEQFGSSDEPLDYRGPPRLVGVTVSVPAGQLPRNENEPGTTSRIQVRLTDWRLDEAPLAVPLRGARVDDRRGQAADAATHEPISNGYELLLSPSRARSLSARAEFRLPVGEASSMTAVPIAVTEAFLASGGFVVGDQVVLRFDQSVLPATITRTMTTVPTLPRSDLAAAADFGLASMLAYQLDQPAPDPTDLLITAGRNESTDIVDALRAQPMSSPTVISRWDRAAALRQDPGQVGIVVALTIALLAAGASAAVGLVANAVNDRRHRVSEIAILRALGTPMSTLRRVLVAEASVVLGVAILLGIGIALVLAQLILPSLAVNVEGLVVVPTPVVVIPWRQILLLVSVVSLITVSVPLLVFRSLERLDTATILRAGEGRG